MMQKYALLIGNSVFLDENLTRLKAPDIDVGALVDLLLDSEIGGFDDVNSLVNVGSTVIRKAIADLYNKKKPDDLLLLYFSGHGILDEQGRLYLAVKDTEHNLLSGTAIPANFITDEMNNSRSKRQVLILDCCHSGAFARGTKGVIGGSAGTAIAFEGTGYGRVVLTATDTTQYAWEGDQIIGKAENSLFTHFLINGLRTGDADANHDGSITVDELYDYIYNLVIQKTPQQTPGKWTFKEQGEIVIARTPGLGREHVISTGQLLNDEKGDAQESAQIEQLYTRGLSAYWLKNWDKAIQNLQAYLQVNPYSSDAETKLRDARRQLRLDDTYNKAQAAIQEEDWHSSIELFENLISEDASYKDGSRQLQFARKKLQLVELYIQAQKLHQAQEWEAVVEVISEIQGIEPDFPGVEGILINAHTKIAELEQQKQLAHLYQDGLVELGANHLHEAKKLFQKIIEINPGYEDVVPLLDKVDEGIRDEEEKRRRLVQMAHFHEQARKLSETRQWRQVIAVFKQIKEIEPDHVDPEGLEEKAERELKKEREINTRKNELATLYSEATSLVKLTRYAEALEIWKKIQELEPAFPDPRRVHQISIQKLAHEKKSQQSKGSNKLLSKRILLGFSLIMAIILILILERVIILNINPLHEPQISTIFNKLSKKADTPTADNQLQTLVQRVRIVNTEKAIQDLNDSSDEFSLLVNFRIIIRTSSDWTTLTIRAPGAVSLGLTKVYQEGEILSSSLTSSSYKNQILNIQQPIVSAESGNWLEMEYDFKGRYSLSQWANEPITFDIEKGAIGQTTIEVINNRIPIIGDSQGTEKYRSALIAYFTKNVEDTEDVKSFSIPPLDLLKTPDLDQLHQVSINLGEVNEELGLSLHRFTGEGVDGLTKIITISSKSALCTVRNGTPARYIYFKVDPDYSLIKANSKIIVVVEYFDLGFSNLNIDYDSSDTKWLNDGMFKPSKNITLTNSRFWKTTSFVLPDAFFRNRQFGIADFRLSTDDTDLIINRVIVISP
jgi:tetratricopeptide (TPR) repeat protein